jgi:hypothetical protein
VTSNDQAARGITTSKVTFLAVAGTVYQVAVDGFRGATGGVVLTVKPGLPPTPPANDNFAEAIDLGDERPITVTGTNANATAEAGEPEHAFNVAVRSVWWKWTAPVTTPVTGCRSASGVANLPFVREGDELEINFNPTKNWTVSASVTKTEAINTAVGSAVDDYIAARMPIWTTLEDPRFTRTTQTINGVTTAITPNNLPVGPKGNLLWWNILGTPFSTVAGYNATNSAATNFASNVDAPMAVFRALIGRPRPQVRKYSTKFNTKLNLASISDHRILKSMSVGGSLRWSDQGSIGFYGLGYDPAKNLTLPANRILQLDPNRPIYSPSETYVDLFVSYRTKLFGDRIRANFQLNVKNVQESGGRLQATGAFFDGRASTYRIVDPRQFILSASFDL